MRPGTGAALAVLLAAVALAGCGAGGSSAGPSSTTAVCISNENNHQGVSIPVCSCTHWAKKKPNIAVTASWIAV